MFPEGIMITDMVPVGELESITIDEMVRFARERGFHAEQSAYELTIRKDGDEVFHQKFFRRKYVPVIDYLTAMSKATGMYRIEILLELISDKKPKPPPQSVEQILRELRFNADEDEGACCYLYGFRKGELEDIVKQGECEPEMDARRFGIGIDSPDTIRVQCIKTNPNGEREISYVVPALMSEEEKRKFFHKKRRWFIFRRD